MPGLSPFGFGGASPPSPPAFVPVYSWRAMPFWRSLVAWVAPAPPAIFATRTGHHIVDAAVAALDATGRFDAVAKHEIVPDAPGQWRTFAWVVGGDEYTDDLWDPIEILKRGSLEVWIAAEGEDPDERDHLLSSLVAAAENALNGQSLAGYTLPYLTLARAGKKAVTVHPIARKLVTVEWAALQGEGFASSYAASE